MQRDGRTMKSPNPNSPCLFPFYFLSIAEKHREVFCVLRQHLEKKIYFWPSPVIIKSPSPLLFSPWSHGWLLVSQFFGSRKLIECVMELSWSGLSQTHAKLNWILRFSVTVFPAFPVYSIYQFFSIFKFLPKIYLTFVRKISTRVHLICQLGSYWALSTLAVTEDRSQEVYEWIRGEDKETVSTVYVLKKLGYIWLYV